MTDCFALFGAARRPWLDPEVLKQQFLALSAQLHPDRVHNAGAEEKHAAQARYTTLNAAYNCLRDPKERLRHFLELEVGKPKEIEQIPPGLMDLFMEVSQLCRKADGFLLSKQKVTSPLLKVGLLEPSEEWRDNLLALQQKINSAQEALMAELKSIDADWSPNARPADRQQVLQQLEELYRLFSYFARWRTQIQERIVQLSL